MPGRLARVVEEPEAPRQRCFYVNQFGFEVQRTWRKSTRLRILPYHLVYTILLSALDVEASA